MALRLTDVMPLYFAYGANLDRIGMAQRCPQARPLGPARLYAYRFIIMADGYATIVPQAEASVHGLLWDIADTEVAALDAFEEVAAGLYRRDMLPVIAETGRHHAAIYLATSTEIGIPRPGYMETVIAAAGACGLPGSYVAELQDWLPRH